MRTKPAIATTIPPQKLDEGRESSFLTLFEALPHAALVVDDHGIVREANQRAAKLLGYRRVELRGLPAQILMASTDSDENWLGRGRHAGILRQQRPAAGFDVNVCHKRGQQIPVEVSVSSLKDGLVLALMREISERRAREEARNEATANRDVLSAMVSHEIKGTVATILGWSQRLARRQWGLGEAREGLEVIAAQARRIERLASSLTDLRELEAGRFRVNPEPLSLGPLIASVASEEETGTSGYGSLRLEVPADLPPVMADPDRIAQVLQNLIANARKYSPHRSPVKVGARAESNVVLAFVEDRGRGIHRDDLETIFMPYSRFVEDRSIGGRGLGLPICRAIIEAHGGRIWAESEGLGRGARIVFTLPLARLAPGYLCNNEGRSTDWYEAGRSSAAR